MSEHLIALHASRIAHRFGVSVELALAIVGLAGLGPQEARHG